MIVPYVAARTLALARAIAMRDAARAGQVWERLSVAARDRMVAEAEQAIREWTRADVVVQFSGEYRER